MSSGETAGHDGGQHDEFTIHIDRGTFKVAGLTITGAGLRGLPDPAIGPDYDIWEDVPGGNDIKVSDDQVVTLRNGMHFFTAPAVIAPGRIPCSQRMT